MVNRGKGSAQQPDNSNALQQEVEVLRRRIAELEQQQTQMQRTLESYEEILDHPQQGHVIIQDACIVLANRAAAEMTGHTVRELLQMCADEVAALIHEADREDSLEYWRQLLSGEAQPERHRRRLLTAHGETRWILGLSMPITFRGKPALDVSFIDITERVEAERALQESEARFRLLTEHAQDIIYRLRLYPKAAFEYVSPAATDIVGYTPEEHYADPGLGTKLVHPDDRYTLAQLTSAETFPREPLVLRWVHKDGSIVWTEQQNMPVYDEDGRLVALEGIARDITERKAAEDALRAERDRAQSYLDVAGVMIVVLDRQGHVTLINQRGCEILGLSEEKILGSNWLERFIAPRDRDMVVEAFDQVLAGEIEAVARFENRIVTAEGDERIIAWRNALVRDDQGEITHILSSGLDITAARRAEEALRSSERRYQALFNNIGDAIFIHDLQGRFMEVSATAIKRLGYSREELLGMSIADIDAPEYVSAGPSRMEEIRREGSATFETAHITRQDERIPIEIRSTLIEYDGRPAILSVARDITRRRLAEEALHASQQHYQTLFHNMSDAVFMVGLDGRFVDVNRTAMERYGYSQDEFRAMTVQDINADDTSLVADRLQQVSQEGEITFEATHITRDGERIATEVHATRIAYGAQEVILSVVRDISERKQLEQQLRQAQKMEAVGRLAGGVAHDFNNLLTIINLQSEFALEELSFRDPLRESIEEILEAGEKAADLTAQLLSFSRQQMIEVRVINPNQVLGSMARMLRRLIGEDVHLETSFPLDVWDIRADRSQLEQVILNLAANARDAMPRGGILSIETTNVAMPETRITESEVIEAGDYVMIAVSDTGIGMTRTVREHIFEPFFTTKDVGQGTGLGLSTAYGIIKQFGGHILVYSEPGLGTTFKIYLPRVQAAAIDRQRGPILRFPRGTETVLVVEDEAQVRRLARQILVQQGYHVVEASSGGEALAMIENAQESVDLVLTDVVMPGMSGKELVEALRRRGYEMAVLYMSGYTDRVISHHGILERNAQLLQKPFTRRDLAAQVRTALDQHEAESQ